MLGDTLVKGRKKVCSLKGTKGCYFVVYVTAEGLMIYITIKAWQMRQVR